MVLQQEEGFYTLIDGEWQLAAEDVTLGAFRFYLKVENRSANALKSQRIKMRVVGVDNGIDQLTNEYGQQATIIYDLMGRRVNNTQNLKGGVYVVNGKKVVIK